MALAIFPVCYFGGGGGDEKLKDTGPFYLLHSLAFILWYTISMLDNLGKFIEWLQAELPSFVAILEEGSTVTGDPIQPEFSDHDITIILERNNQNDIQAIYDWLERNPFDNSYLFSIRVAREFLFGDSLNDLSMKFRSRVITGEDVVKEKQLPNQMAAKRIGEEGLNGLVIRCERRWLNLSHWTLSYSQQMNYEIFKYFFVFYAAKQYGDTGKYPQTREHVAESIEQKELAYNVLRVVNNIGTSTKKEQKIAFEAMISIIKNLK